MRLITRRVPTMLHRCLVTMLLVGGTCGLAQRAAAADTQVLRYTFVPQDGRPIELLTDDPRHDVLTALRQQHQAVGDPIAAPSAPAGTTYIDANGRAWPIGVSTRTARVPKTTYPELADTCAQAAAATTAPLAITGADLPFDGTFNVSAATDDGDFRGSSADSISAAGGNDAFWTFTPSVSGLYTFTITAGSSAGIGVWQGACGALTEVGTSFNLMGGGTSSMGATLTVGQTYSVIWEDHFPGSVESSARLQIVGPITPQGGTYAEAVDLTGESWSTGFSVAADNSANTNSLSFPSSACDLALDGGVGGGHGGAGGDGNDIWFRLPPTLAGRAYQVEGLAGSMTNSVFVLYSRNVADGPAGALTIETCNDDKNNTGAHGGNDFMSQIEFTAAAGKVYYLFAESYALSGPGNGSFTLTGTGPALAELRLLENFYIDGSVMGNARFIDTESTTETPSAADVHPLASRIDRGLDSGLWGGYVTTGSLYLYGFTGSSYQTTTTVVAGYLLLGANTSNETGGYFYSYFPSSRLSLATSAARLEWVQRYGGAASTTTSLRVIVRSDYKVNGVPTGWLVSSPVLVSGLTGSFATTPVQIRNELYTLDWFAVTSPSITSLDALAAADEAPLVWSPTPVADAAQRLNEVNGFGFMVNADILPGGFVNGLIFDSIVLKGETAPREPSAAGNWSAYE